MAIPQDSLFVSSAEIKTDRQIDKLGSVGFTVYFL